MNIRDRLMSRASVAVMAAFAPDPPAADHSKVGQSERVEDADAGGGGGGDPFELSAEERAQLDAMQGGTVPEDRGNVDPAGDDAGEVDADGDGDDEGDASDGDPAPRDGAGDQPGDKSGDEAPARKPPKTINYGRHQKELQKAAKEREDLQARLAAAEKERNEAREARTRLDERTKLLLEAINTKAAAATPKENPDPEPDADADPLAHIQWENRQLRKEMEAIKTGRQQEQQVSAAEAEERKVYGDFEADLVAEASSDKDFADAFGYLRDTRYRELGFIYAGIDVNDAAQCATLTPQQQKVLSDSIQQAFYNEQIMTARAAQQSGKRSAPTIKNLAIARGWKPKAAAEAPAAGDPPARANGKGNGAPPPARRAEPPASVSDQLEAIRKNQQDSKSLSDASGSEGGEMTLERLTNMPPEEFEEFLALNKGKVDRMMGKVPQ